MHKQVTELLFQPELCIKSFWIFDFGPEEGAWNQRCLQESSLAGTTSSPACNNEVGMELSDDGWLLCLVQFDTCLLPGNPAEFPLY